MNDNEARRLLDETFNAEFNSGKFSNFLNELFNGFYPHDRSISPHSEYAEKIASIKKIGNYKQDNKSMEILIVQLKKGTSLDRARTMQRNVVAKLLKNFNIDSALVAFISEDSSDWRFSFVKMDYKLTKDGKVSEELTPAKRYSFLVGPNEPNHTCRSQFIELIKTEIHKPSINEIETAFSIEKVTKEFFEKYKSLYHSLKEDLDNLIKKDKNIREEFENKQISTVDFAKKLLGQIVFLYFLQKKGWLGVEKGEKGKFEQWGKGSRKFIQELFYKAQKEKKNFFNDYLEPLFYHALATDRRADGDYYEKFNCKIPFLNGGLFEPLNGYNWGETDINLDNDLFEEIFKTFDEFNFTIKEDEPLEKEVAVDPEMLGKVFENLLDVEDRKSKGAFYTPREIVHYMCQQSLINYLETNIDIPRKDLEFFIQKGDLALEYLRRQEIGRDVKEEFVLPNLIKKNAKELDRLLTEIKICDPAVGSGAFPVGMMNEIIKARTILSYLLKISKTDYELKREAIENSLYGVDTEPSAVEITKLRFWLSLIVDEEDMNNIKPLPNLENKIMCGNSLIEEFEGIKLYIDPTEIRERKDKQATLDQSIDKKVKKSEQKLRELRLKQKEFFDVENRTQKNRLKGEIDKIEWEFIEETLREQGDGENMKKLEQYKKNKSKPFFLWKLYFSDVFHRDNPGFDVVIANPPYVDSENMVKNMPKEREILSKIYSTAKGNWDLYIPFFELGFNVLREKGILSFISPNKWLSIKYGRALRGFFSDYIYSLCNCDAIKVFEAGNTPEISFVKKVIVDLPVILHSFEKDYRLSERGNVPRSLFKEDNWGIVLSQNLNCLIKILEAEKKIGDYCSPENPFTVSEAYTLKKHIYEGGKTNKNKDLKLINTGTIDKYLSLWGASKTSYIKDKYQYPYINKKEFKKNLPRRFEQSKSQKIIISGIRYFECFFDECGEYVAGKSTVIIRKIKPKISVQALLAILNSRLISFYIKEAYSATGIGGGVNFTVPMIEKLPCPDITKEKIKELENFSKKINNLTKEDNYLKNPDKQAKVKAYEKEIDKMVYDIYGLTEKEIKIVDGENENKR